MRAPNLPAQGHPNQTSAGHGLFLNRTHAIWAFKLERTGVKFTHRLNAKEQIGPGSTVKQPCARKAQFPSVACDFLLAHANLGLAEKGNRKSILFGEAPFNAIPI